MAMAGWKQWLLERKVRFEFISFRKQADSIACSGLACRDGDARDFEQLDGSRTRCSKNFRSCLRGGRRNVGRAK